MIGHGGLLRAFSFARPIRGSQHSTNLTLIYLVDKIAQAIDKN